MAEPKTSKFPLIYTSSQRIYCLKRYFKYSKITKLRHISVGKSYFATQKRLENELARPKNARIIGLADIIHIHLRIKNHGISQTKKEKPSSSLWP
jgi:hypothetical protein